MFSKSLIYLFLLIFCVSCVGTVEDTSEEVTQDKTFKDFGIVFSGVEKAVPIAHNKADVAFRPATGGSGIFTYVVYRDGNFSTPVSSALGVATNLDAEGYYHLQVGGLMTGSSYTFVVRAFDVINDVEDTNTNMLAVRTLSYEVPLFNGISALENVGGADGETKLEVKWNLAVPSSQASDPFGANPNAISGYSIYAGSNYNSMTLAASVLDPTARSFILTNLTPGTRYFVQVRSRNSATPSQEELNIKYMQKETLLSNPIQFNGLQSLTIPPTTLGYSQLNLGWTAGSGSFDRYRIFISSTPVSAFNPATDTPVSTLQNPAASTFTLATGVSAHTTYYVAVVACKGDACTEYAGHNVVRSVKTTPPIAPFNGIASLVQPSDATGLSSLRMTWAAPDTTAGVFNEIRIYRTNASGLYNPITDLVPPYNPGTPSVPGYDVSLTTATGTVIKGLTTGSEACFVAKAFVTNPFDSANPLGRTHTNEVKACAIPQYTAPGFAGVNSLCTEVTSSSFKISWPTPTPLGIFDRYYIWLMPNDVDPFVFNDAIAGLDNRYDLRIAAKNRTDMVLTELNPNTTYRIGMRTYFYNPVTNAEVYDSNIVVANCSTVPAKVEHNGWYDVMSLGRKMNGLASPPEPLKEKIALSESPYDHPFPQVLGLGGTLGLDASDQGIIRISWADFSLTGLGKKLIDLPGATNGYRVYRKDWVPAHALAPPQITDGDWGAALNNVLIAPEILNDQGVVRSVASFVDYTVTRPADPLETKMYWYKVEAVLNNNTIEYETLPTDGVIKVVLPPDNMALVHRWVANRDMCTKMALAPIRSQNYRCVFNGLSSIADGGLRFYDMEKDMLVDRFSLGIKFTRGTDAKKCTSGPAGWEGIANVPARGIIQGDCIGTVAPSGVVSAPRGAIYYQRNNGVSSINRSAVAGTTWTVFDDLQPLETGNNATPLAANDASMYPAGTGLGTELTINNANLPPLVLVGRNMSQHICAAHTVKHKGVTKLKRLLRRKENMTAIQWHPRVTALTIENGTLQVGAVDRDCNTNNKGGNLAILNFLDNKYPYSTTSARSMTTGSSGDYSTEACVSRYGIQDLVGNVSNWNSDTLYCPNANFCGTRYKDIDQTDPIGPNEFGVVDPGAWDTMKNGDGTYLDWNWGSDDGFAGGTGVASNAFFNVTTGTPRISYLSIPLGVPLTCGGTRCVNKSDDNTRVTQFSTATDAVVTNYPTNSDTWRNKGQYSPPTVFYSWISGGHHASANYAGQFYVETAFNTHFGNDTIGTRCSIQLDD